MIIGCTVTPWKCCAPAFAVTEAWIASKALRDGVGIAQVQLHAADVGLVGDGLGVELEHDRVADLVRRMSRASASVAATSVCDRRNAVGGEQLLRFGLGQDGAAGCARLLDDLVGQRAVGRPVGGILRQGRRLVQRRSGCRL